MKSFKRLVWLVFGLVTFLQACHKDSSIKPAIMDSIEIPLGFPAIVFPSGNEFTIERWNLGKSLFHEKALSLNNSVSCASCHKAEFAFSDNVAFSLGDQNQIGTSNAPSLCNMAYNPYYTRAGGVPTLEMQILVPIQEHVEFNSNIVDIAEKLKQIPAYNDAAQKCYQRDLDPFVIVRAIANYERSFISGNSNFDKYFYQGNKNALSQSEIRGMNLFMGDKTNCSKCHNGFNFSNYAFENNGLYEDYADIGRMRLTHLEGDRARFKVPTLRNIAFTAPYMHDGSLKTLDEVVEHYNSGGKKHENKSLLIKELYLTNTEKEDLVAFLKSLSDYSFINNKNFQ